MARPRKEPEQANERTSAEAEQERYEAMAESIGEPDPPRVRPEPKPDHRTAIQIERDEQAKVETALGMRLIGRPLKGADDA